MCVGHCGIYYNTVNVPTPANRFSIQQTIEERGRSRRRFNQNQKYSSQNGKSFRFFSTSPFLTEFSRPQPKQAHLFTAVVIALSAIATIPATVTAQRPPYAGQRPTGYHDRLNNTDVVPLANRFGGNNNAAAPTQQLPTAALGDAVLVNQLNQRPVDQRPFWLINYEAIEAQKNSGQRPSSASSATASTTTNANTISNSNLLPDLTNRFAADDVPVRPTAITPEASLLGSHNDVANFAISQPEIVYPLGGVTVATSAIKQPQVITLNGQAFLLTPLAPVQPVQRQPPHPIYFD